MLRLRQCQLVAAVVTVCWLLVGHTTTLQAGGLRAALRTSAGAVSSKIAQAGTMGALSALLLFTPLVANAHECCREGLATAPEAMAQQKGVSEASLVSQEEATMSADKLTRDELSFLMNTSYFNFQLESQRRSVNRIFAGGDSSRWDRAQYSFAISNMISLGYIIENLASNLPNSWQRLYNNGISISHSVYDYERRFAKKDKNNKLPPLPVIDDSSGASLAYSLGKLKVWAEEAQLKIRSFEQQKAKQLRAKKKRNNWRWAGRY